MKTVNHTRHYDVEREIIQAMSASLKLMLEDLRAQYQHLQVRSERLKDSGVAVARIHRQLDLIGKEVKASHGKTNSDRRVRRTRIRAEAGR